MRRRLLPLVARHEPRGQIGHHIKSAIGATIGMCLIGALAIATHLPLLLAPFGATAVLLFGQPNSPLAQPINVVGGYIIAAVVAVLIMIFAPGIWWLAAASVGLVIGIMLVLRVTHPPAGAVPIVAYVSTLAPWTMFSVISMGSICLVAYALIHHRLPPRQQYPRS